MKQFHSWAKLKLKNHASIVLNAPTDDVFVGCGSLGFDFVDEADSTLPPLPQLVQVWPKHVPVRCRRLWRWVGGLGG